MSNFSIDDYKDAHPNLFREGGCHNNRVMLVNANINNNA